MGKHLLLEVYDINFDLLNNKNTLLEAMERGILNAGMHILNIFSHSFDPYGVTIVIALAESHVSCHTWPEKGSIAIDAYTCGGGDPNLIVKEILLYLNSTNFSLRELSR